MFEKDNTAQEAVKNFKAFVSKVVLAQLDCRISNCNNGKGWCVPDKDKWSQTSDIKEIDYDAFYNRESCICIEGWTGLKCD